MKEGKEKLFHTKFIYSSKSNYIFYYLKDTFQSLNNALIQLMLFPGTSSALFSVSALKRNASGAN